MIDRSPLLLILLLLTLFSLLLNNVAHVQCQRETQITLLDNVPSAEYVPDDDGSLIFAFEVSKGRSPITLSLNRTITDSYVNAYISTVKYPTQFTYAHELDLSYGTKSAFTTFAPSNSVLSWFWSWLTSGNKPLIWYIRVYSPSARPSPIRATAHADPPESFPIQSILPVLIPVLFCACCCFVCVCGCCYKCCCSGGGGASSRKREKLVYVPIVISHQQQQPQPQVQQRHQHHQQHHQHHAPTTSTTGLLSSAHQHSRPVTYYSATSDMPPYAPHHVEASAPPAFNPYQQQQEPQPAAQEDLPPVFYSRTMNE